MNTQPPVEERPIVPRNQDPRNPMMQLRQDWHNFLANLWQLLNYLPIVKWPTEYGDYPVTLKFLRLMRQPRLILTMVRLLLEAKRDGKFIAGYTGSGSFGKQTPAVYKRHRSAFMRRLRWLRECVVPTIFIKGCEWTEVQGYQVEGYEVSIYFWLKGKSRSYGIGRRGQLLYEPPPPMENEPPDWFMPDSEPMLETCPVCDGFKRVAYLTEDSTEPRKIGNEETLADFETAGAWIEDCDNCEGTGKVEADDVDDEPDCIRVYGGGYSITGY